MKKFFIIFVLGMSFTVSNTHATSYLPQKSYDFFELCKKIQQYGVIKGIKDHAVGFLTDKLKIY